MKTLLSKLINRYTIGLYIAFANSVAFAASPFPQRLAPGWIAGGILAAAVVGGIIAFSGNHDDDDDDILLCQ
ncbi:hypothetical protein ACNVED_07330 [Legionella sp. D16C41]|uniref:hypothetical protein n=1 Tax=Legionella sp. D16C41 TaxID=3402688 RepID=UPI003AF66BBF